MPDETLLIWRYENVLAGKLLEQGCRLAEIRRQNIDRIAGDPRGKINRLVISGVKTDQDPTRLAADIFDRVPKSLWNITNITGVQLFGAKSTVRPKHCYVQVTADYILPFIGVWMPVKFAQGARFEVENYAGNCCRNWKSRGIDAPFAPAFEIPCGAPASIRNLCVSGGERRGP
jgi:hypothetical protein